MRPEILVIDRRGEEAGPVERRLRARGARYATLFLEDLHESLHVPSFRIGQGRGGELTCVDGRTRQAFSTAGLRSVWAESLAVPPNPMASYHGGDELERTFRIVGESESWIYTHSVIALLSRRCLFLPAPMERNRANHRLYQAAVARDAGFALPRLYLGNHARRLFQSLRPSMAEKVHYQPLSPLSFHLKGRRFVSADRFVDPDREFTLAHIKAPALFSCWPEASRRLLVAVLGEDAWALEVGLRDRERDPDVTDLAYQAAQGNLRIEPAEPPAAALGLCRAFLGASGLPFAVFDLLEQGAEGGGNWDFCFLGAQPDGRFPFFDEAGLPVYERLVDWLERGSG